MKRKTVTALIIIMVIASVMLFAGCITDNAYYSASGKDLGKIDYDMVITNAKKAGYMVDGPYYVNAKQKIGLHPLDIRELDERFGEDYRIFLVKIYYTEDAFFEVTLPRDYGGETRIHFFNESRPDPFFSPFELKDLQNDEWIIEKFKLMFGFDEQEAGHYLTQLKDSINREQEPEIVIKEPPDLLAVYNNLKETSSNSTFSLPVGEGWCKETFYSGKEKIGVIDYIVQSVKIIHRDKGHEYTIHIDQLGGADLEIKLGVGEKIPEEEYRGIFKDMFVNLGLPSERVDEFEFMYSPSIW